MDARRKRQREPKVQDRSTGGQALADGLATGLFVLVSAPIGQLGKEVAPVLGIGPDGASMAIMLTWLIAMSFVCERLGGALFNPANNAFMYALGKGSAREHAVRSVAQCFGGAVGALLAVAFMPSLTTETVGLAYGVRKGVSLLEGAGCEFVLGALLAFVVLCSGEFNSSVLKLWVPLFATVLAVKAGGGMTGPSLNPAFTFAWVFLYPEQTLVEHLLVFWLAPIAAGLFGGWAFLGWQQSQAARAGSGRQQRRRSKAD